MPCFDEMQAKYLNTLINILNSPDQLREAIKDRQGVNSEFLDAGIENMIKACFNQEGFLNPDIDESKFYRDKQRTVQYSIGLNTKLSPLELLAITSAFFVAGGQLTAAYVVTLAENQDVASEFNTNLARLHFFVMDAMSSSLILTGDQRDLTFSPLTLRKVGGLDSYLKNNKSRLDELYRVSHLIIEEINKGHFKSDLQELYSLLQLQQEKKSSVQDRLNEYSFRLEETKLPPELKERMGVKSCLSRSSSAEQLRTRSSSGRSARRVSGRFGSSSDLKK